MSVFRWFNKPPIFTLESPAKDLLAAIVGNPAIVILGKEAQYYAYESKSLRIKPWFAKLSRLRTGAVGDYFEPQPEDSVEVVKTGEDPTTAETTGLFEMDAKGSPVRVGFRVLFSEIVTSAPAMAYKGDVAVFDLSPEPVTTPTVSITRYPVIEADKALAPGLKVEFTIDLASTPPDGIAQPESLAITGLPVDWEQELIDVEVASGFIDFKTSTGSILLKRDGTSNACHLSGIVRSDCAVGQAIPVIVTFLREGRVCGFIRRIFTAGQPAEVPASAPIGFDFEAEPPVLTVRIFKLDRGRLLWSALISPGLDIGGLPGQLKGEIDLGEDPASFVVPLFAKLSQLKPGDHMGTFNGLGEQLWRLAPDFFRRAYWALRKSLGETFAIQFISDDAYIPWELMRPVPPDSNADGPDPELLAMTHPIARCVGDSQGTLRYRLPAGKIATIAPQYLKANDRLERAQTETQMLQKQYAAAPIAGTKAAVWTLLTKGLDSNPVSILHFAGHGDFPVTDPGQALLQLQDANLTVTEVDTSEVKLGNKSHCLVFFNACKTGATGGLLGGVGGWADTLLRRQFGGFIAPLWAVDDEDAATVSASLFDNLVNRKIPVSQALLAVRKSYGKKSPTYLAYLFYGDVGARIQ